MSIHKGLGGVNGCGVPVYSPGFLLTLRPPARGGLDVGSHSTLDSSNGVLSGVRTANGSMYNREITDSEETRNHDGTAGTG